MTPSRKQLAWLILPATLAALALLVPSDSPESLSADAPEQPATQDSRQRSASVVHSTAAQRGPAARHQVYRTDEVMIAPAWGEDLAAIAADYGAEVLRQPGHSGFGMLKIPVGLQRAALMEDARVLSAAPNALIAGAGKSDKDSGRKNNKKDKNDDPVDSTPSDETSESTPTDSTDTPTDNPGSSSSAAALQWHLSDIDIPSGIDLSGVIVAVLDTGVAYESDRIRGQDYAQAPSLAGVPIVAPYDFVDSDDQPLDHHQHGTHIASLIASDGDVVGVSPGVSLMPLRVLNEDNAGSEYDLIEAIAWAVSNKADVINMSLTFPAGYVPSGALKVVLQDAADAGVVMVAAAGNDGRDDAPYWPAASPLVIGVGAYVAESGGSDTETAYSNLGTGIDLMAPGGDILIDHNEDGVADGMIGETFAVNAPDEIGVWMFEGTSQAAAVVSGAAAWLVGAGSSGDEVRAALMYGSKFWGNHSFTKGTGAGGLDIDDALESLDASAVVAPPEYYAAMLAWPAVEVDVDGNEIIRAVAEITVINADGSYPSQKLEVYGTVWGPSGPEPVSCNLSNISCTLETDAIARFVDGEQQEAAWAIQVDAIIESDIGIPRRPGVAMFGSDGLEILLSAIDAESNLKSSALAIGWAEEQHPELGAVAEGFTVLNSGTGLSSSPLGLVFTAGALPMGNPKDVDLDLDGTGLSSSPLGTLRIQRVNIDGTGLSSSPLGFKEQKLVVFSGTGLSSSPLGIRATDIFAPGGGSIDAGLGLNSSSLLLTTGSLVGSSSGASSVFTDGFLAEGQLSSSGYEVASLLVGSGAAAVGMTSEGDAVAGGNAGVALP